jgi:hypothetical protein
MASPMRCTRRALVRPGVPGGLRATITTRSPCGTARCRAGPPRFTMLMSRNAPEAQNRAICPRHLRI